MGHWNVLFTRYAQD
jgi:hypothetical protein